MPATDLGEGAGGAPSPTMRLLLEASVAERPRAEAAWAAWLDAVDIEDLEDGATPLLSLVSRNLDDLRADRTTEGRVRGVHRQTWARNQLLWAAGAPLVDRLGERAGAPLLLPSTSLLLAYDGDWGARPFGRVTISLPPDAVDLARQALGDVGWGVDHLTPSLVERTRAGLVERWQSEDTAGNEVTIRWHVLRRISSPVADEQLRGAAVAVAVGSSAVHVLHPADALVERLWSGAGESTHGWIADAVQLARRLTAERDGRSQATARFARRAQHLGIVPALLERLEVVAAVIPDAAVVEALDGLRATRPGPTSMLWTIPGAAGRLGRAWAGHAAGQGAARGARSLLRARWSSRQVRGSAQRR
jgi:hypothetical protein